jgi:hypothetical protein
MLENIEYCIVPDNIPIRTARQLMNHNTMPRGEKEDKEIEQTIKGVNINKEKNKKEYVQCCKCSQFGIKTKHLKSSMMKKEYEVKRSGENRTEKYCRYWCKACARKFKAHNKCAGGKDF